MIAVTPDTNTYISALQFKGIGLRVLAMARAGTIRMDTSGAILSELAGVLRDKFKWEGYRLHFAILELRKLANVVNPKMTIAACDDPDDDRILECAVEAGSDYILTFDKDLLRLGEHAGIPIVRPSDFLRRGMER